MARTRTPALALAAACGLALPAASLARQDSAPPAQPESAQPDTAQPGADRPGISQPPAELRDERGRRVLDLPPETLGFRNARVDQIVTFIVRSTGKVVMPQPDVLSRTVTVMSDRAIPADQALDMVFMALHQAGIAVVENQDVIILRDISEIDRQDVPVLGPDESVLDRADLGAIAEKVFALRSNTAEAMGELLEESIPSYAKLTVDTESNQIAVMGNIALLQRIERLVGSLDRPAAGALAAETFRLRYADAELIKSNIEELYGSGTARQGAANNNQGNRNQQQGQQQGQQRGGFNPFGPQAAQGQQQAAPSSSMRVTANTQQNSVTVLAEPAVLDAIRTQIDGEWDLPLPDEAVVPKIYDLVNSDPVKVRDLLEGLFGRASSGTGGGQAQGANRTTGTSQGVGRLAGQFSFEAIPESGRLVVVAKSPDNLAVIDDIIADLDKPQTVGLPEFVELKHASSEELAEQLNTLLSQDGTLAQIRRSESGLSDTQSNQSPFAQEGTDDAAQDDEAAPDTMTFWWQRSRPPTDSRGPSNLIGQIRIVPVWRQNAVMVLSPPEYRASIVGLIRDLDRPGRQVLLAAVVAEVSRDDATALGLRWSSEAINLTNTDNAIGVGANATATEANLFGQLFDTSVLNANISLNAVLQALAEKTAVNILSEPRIFTSDNQEAEFFNGQDIPFITESQTTDNGTLTQSTDYRAVGIQLRARPRITVDRKVDLRVNLELSAIAPGQTANGQFIVDRRETTTQLIVRDGQTVVISGILRRERSDIVRKIPLLGDIPLIGAIFRSTEKTDASTELLVFITPMVVDNPEETEDLNRPYRDRLERQRAEQGQESWDRPAAPPNVESGDPGTTSDDPAGRG